MLVTSTCYYAEELNKHSVEECYLCGMFMVLVSPPYSAYRQTCSNLRWTRPCAPLLWWCQKLLKPTKFEDVRSVRKTEGNKRCRETLGQKDGNTKFRLCGGHPRNHIDMEDISEAGSTWLLKMLIQMIHWRNLANDLQRFTPSSEHWTTQKHSEEPRSYIKALRHSGFILTGSASDTLCFTVWCYEETCQDLHTLSHTLISWMFEMALAT